MIEALIALAAISGVPTPPEDQAYITCAFQRAGELASATGDSPEAVADRVVDACAEADGADAPPMTDATRHRVRTAAIAVVNRRRGLDGQPPDAPIRLPSSTSTSQVASLHIPDEIAPAVLPYMSCRLGSAGVPLRRSRDGADVAPAVAVGADCSDSRAEAARHAEAMLRAQRRGSRSDRRAFVERVLLSIDDFVTTTLAPPPAEEGHDAPDR